ncbi:TetR/AcrR family transcriptional regulator [Nocardiopsis coralliicola]
MSAEHAPGSAAARPLRERLVGAAWDLVGEGGPGAVTLREVGRRTGVSRTAPYRHFSGKDDLLRAVAVRGFAGLRADIVAARGQGGGAHAAVRALCRAYIAFAQRNPAQYRLMFGDWVLAQKHSEDPRTSELHAAAEQLFAAAAGAVADGQAAGALRSGDPDDLTLLTWSTLHGLVVFTLSKHLQHAPGAPAGAPGAGADPVLLDRIVGEIVQSLSA